ncbi:ferritin-like domain-containing protein [Irpex rosettiformis]|uniref:Ferritin-like domain-containing protein n=1 Tax=Irpex rosettiformis TaxID=378272 RepID=A0ACB8U291_9APHY|nr:ferritin-like domain-containing protein [Irpex rosettiformis]
MSRFQTILRLVLTASLAITSLAAPHVSRRADGVTDTQLLQFALTLEHLESTFYNQALDKFNDKAFADAGYESWVRGRFEQMRSHEQTHVDFLTKALGDAAPRACTYDFPYNDPKSFVALSMALETVGGSAYMGAAQFLQNKDTLTQAASILAVESRHAAWAASAVLKGSPWDGSFETPLTVDGVYSLASQFIVSCPSTNPTLIAKPLPKLTIEPTSPAAGQHIKFNFNHDEVKHDGDKLYAAWFDGITVHHTDLGDDDRASIPQELQGTVYGAIVKTKESNPTKQDLLTGLVMFEIGFSSYAPNP